MGAGVARSKRLCILVDMGEASLLLPCLGITSIDHMLKQKPADRGTIMQSGAWMPKACAAWLAVNAVHNC